VQVIDSPLQMHRKNQPHESEVMIPMQMADENMIDPVEVSLQTHELHLCAFATINEEIPVLYFNKL
jgi:hypothetical protein